MNRYEACQLLCTERAPHGSSTPEWSSLPQTTAGRPNCSYVSGSMKSRFTRTNLKISRVSSNAWRGTVAAQTNEQLRERILFEKPGSSVTNLFSSLQDKKSQPSQTITNYPKFYSSTVLNLGMRHDRSDKYACQNTPKPSETETS